MYRILVPTELTYLSSCALKLGLEIAKVAKAKIDVLSVVEPNFNHFMEEEDQYSHDSMSSLKNIQLREDARQKMHERTEEITQWFPDQKIAPKIVFGNQIQEMLKEVEKLSSNMVVLGADLFESSDKKTIEFLKQSAAPVLALKCMISGLEKFKDIVFLADPENDSPELIRHLKKLQDLLGAKLHVLRVNTPQNFLSPKKCSATLEQYASFHQLENMVLESFDATTEIQGLMAYGETVKNAFTAIGIHDRSFLQRLMTNNFKVEEVIAVSDNPVWTFKG